MGLFSWFLGDGVKLATSNDDPKAREIRKAVKRCEFDTVCNFFTELTDPDEREFYLNVVTDFDGRPEFFDECALALPESAQAYLLRGSHSFAGRGKRALAVKQRMLRKKLGQCSSVV